MGPAPDPAPDLAPGPAPDPVQVRQRAGVGSHPDAAAVLGDLADCWMVNDITPDFSSWHVKVS